MKRREFITLLGGAAAACRDRKPRAPVRAVSVSIADLSFSRLRPAPGANARRDDFCAHQLKKFANFLSFRICPYQCPCSRAKRRRGRRWRRRWLGDELSPEIEEGRRAGIAQAGLEIDR